MFLPLHDKNPLKLIPFQWINTFFVVTCVIIYFMETSSIFYSFSLIPAVFFGQTSLQTIVGSNPGFELINFPSVFTSLSYIFLHADFMHLFGNMLFLWTFGDNVEDEMGHVRYFFFFLLCGLLAGLAHALLDPSSDIALVGASGAVSGILGAYLVLHPRVKVLVLFTWIPVRLPARWLLVAWIILQVIFFLTDSAGGVAWFAHIIGFIAGVFLIPLFRKPDRPLFDKGVEH